MILDVSAKPLDLPRGAKPKRRSLTFWEMLVWTYKDQRAHAYLGSVPGWCEFMVGLAAPTEDTPRAPVHIDAARVHVEVCDIGEDAARMVPYFAKTGSWPEPCTAIPEPHPIMDVDRHCDTYGRAERNGRLCDYKILIERETEWVPTYETKNGKVERTGEEARLLYDAEWCPITWWPSPLYIDEQNNIYRRWAEIIADLRERLATTPFRNHHIMDLE